MLLTGNILIPRAITFWVKKNNSQGFLKCKYFDQMIFTGQSCPLFVPCQETEMAAVQIPFVKKLQTKLQEIYYTIPKYKNEIIFAQSFVFIGLFLRPRCYRKEA